VQVGRAILWKNYWIRAGSVSDGRGEEEELAEGHGKTRNKQKQRHGNSRRIIWLEPEA